MVEDVFGGTCMSQLHCYKYGHCSFTRVTINGLFLEVADAAFITEALVSYTKTEMTENIM